MKPGSDEELRAFYRVVAPYYDRDHLNFYDGKDVAVFLEWSRAARGGVLDMGCGTGRVTLPLARAGLEVCAMDNSPEMLAQLRQSLRREPDDVRRRVRIIEGDIRNAAPDRRYGVVLATGHVLHSFLTRADQRAWLRNVRSYLEPGGSFIFDTFQFDYLRLAQPQNEWLVDVDRVEEKTRRRVQRFVRVEHFPIAQEMRIGYRWVVTGVNGQIESEEEAWAAQRWFTRAELENLLELEGFLVAEYRGTYGGVPFGPELMQFLQIVRAVQAA